MGLYGGMNMPFTGLPYQGSLFGGGAMQPPNAAAVQGAAGVAGANPPGGGSTAPPMIPPAPGQYQIPPELIQQAAQQSQVGLESANLDRQQKLADMLRSDSEGQLKGVQAGRRYVAPGAANMVASLMGGVYGGMQGNDIMAQRKAMAEEGKKYTKGFLGAAGAGGGAPDIETSSFGS